MAPLAHQAVATGLGLSEDERVELLAAARRMAGFSVLALHREAVSLSESAQRARVEGRWRRVDAALVFLALDLLEQKFLQDHPEAARAHLRGLPAA